MSKKVPIVNLQKEIIGYTIAELRQLCPSYSKIKQHIAFEKRTHEFRNKYEPIYNSKDDLLENEI